MAEPFQDFISPRSAPQEGPEGSPGPARFSPPTGAPSSDMPATSQGKVHPEAPYQAAGEGGLSEGDHDGPSSSVRMEGSTAGSPEWGSGAEASPAAPLTSNGTPPPEALSPPQVSGSPWETPEPRWGRLAGEPCGEGGDRSASEGSFWQAGGSSCQAGERGTCPEIPCDQPRAAPGPHPACSAALAASPAMGDSPGGTPTRLRGSALSSCEGAACCCCRAVQSGGLAGGLPLQQRSCDWSPSPCIAPAGGARAGRVAGAVPDEDETDMESP